MLCQNMGSLNCWLGSEKEEEVMPRYGSQGFTVYGFVSRVACFGARVSGFELTT
jgi:hypothetical protein